MVEPLPKKNGYIDMVGDLFHFGHVRQIRRVHAMGFNVLIGVHSDECVATYKRRPVMSMAERIEVVEACKYVSQVIPDAPLAISISAISRCSQ